MSLFLIDCNAEFREVGAKDKKPRKRRDLQTAIAGGAILGYRGAMLGSAATPSAAQLQVRRGYKRAKKLVDRFYDPNINIDPFEIDLTGKKESLGYRAGEAKPYLDQYEKSSAARNVAVKQVEIDNLILKNDLKDNPFIVRNKTPAQLKRLSKYEVISNKLKGRNMALGAGLGLGLAATGYGIKKASDKLFQKKDKVK